MASSIATDPRGRATLVAVALLLATTPVAAQAPSREALAQALFDEAKALYEKESWDAACEKFQSSHELDPRGGTLFNLALCREKQGRTASAWSAFAEAKNLSSKEGRKERVSFAEARLRELERTVPRLRVRVTRSAPNLVVRLDGQVLPEAAWDTAVPVDPGAHQLEASAPRHTKFLVSVTATAATTGAVSIPALTEERVAPARRVDPPPDSVRWPGWALGGAGVIALGTGGAFGALAFQKRSEAESLCARGLCGDGERRNAEGVTAAWVSNIAIGVGAVLTVVGVYLLVRPSSKAASASLAPESLMRR